MTDDRKPTRAERIAAARQALADAYARYPDMVDRFNGRMARIDAARKRERERVEHLALGKPRPTIRKRVRAHNGRRRTVEVPIPIDPTIEEAVRLREGHFGRATPETARAAATHVDSLDQMETSGTITKAQRAWATEIANVHRSIESDVAVKIASLEARVDNSSGGRNLAAEGIQRVRLHHAYSIWREALPAPKQLVLDMIVGDAIGYTVAARRYRVHNRKAKRVLLAAIDLWPSCVARAFDIVDASVHYALNRGQAVDLPDGWREPLRALPPASAALSEMPTPSAPTIDPGPLPEPDAAFLDERGYLKPWSEIADVIRERLFGDLDEAA